MSLFIWIGTCLWCHGNHVHLRQSGGEDGVSGSRIRSLNLYRIRCTGAEHHVSVTHALFSPIFHNTTMYAAAVTAHQTRQDACDRRL